MIDWQLIMTLDIIGHVDQNYFKIGPLQLTTTPGRRHDENFTHSVGIGRSRVGIVDRCRGRFTGHGLA
jgi:hypothetical protein